MSKKGNIGEIICEVMRQCNISDNEMKEIYDKVSIMMSESLKKEVQKKLKIVKKEENPEKKKCAHVISGDKKCERTAAEGNDMCFQHREDKVKCIFTTKENKQCSRNASEGSDFCTQHKSKTPTTPDNAKKVRDTPNAPKKSKQSSTQPSFFSENESGNDLYDFASSDKSGGSDDENDSFGVSGFDDSGVKGKTM